MKKGSKFPAKRAPEETDALLPFMSLLLIIIPMLLSNMAFHHFLAIEASVPGVSDEQESQTEPEEDKKKEKMVMARLLIQNDFIEGEILDEETAEVMDKLKEEPSRDGAKSIFDLYSKYKLEFPKLDTVLVTIHQDVDYQRLVEVIDQIKKPVERSLASVDGVEKTKFNLVLLPMALDGTIEEGDL